MFKKFALLAGMAAFVVACGPSQAEIEAKSPQSSLNRDIAESVRDLLTGVTDPVAAPAAAAAAPVK